MRLRDIYAESFTARSVPREEPGRSQAPTPKPEPNTTTTHRRTAEAAHIVATWERVLGVKLNEGVVEAHLETLRRWEARLLERHSQSCVINEADR